jgi:hypothetical protein
MLEILDIGKERLEIRGSRFRYRKGKVRDKSRDKTVYKEI